MFPNLYQSVVQRSGRPSAVASVVFVDVCQKRWQNLQIFEILQMKALTSWGKT